ncbi:hypothetical protein B0O80DRAFT_465459 [Mortierella sp. GBAus27b]|nr:hypothetical protein BGX31_010031 [Mortierella sp. GBA43]KAI8347577.1 hypothetical protein B0O80DRAFT_465459 [Mortierella sp. GBAus27b]
MFGCIVAGRLVQTNLQQVDVNKFTFQLDDAENINHIVVFLLGTVPFQPGYAATVHLLWPNKTWQLLGMLSNEKASAIFRLKTGVANSRSHSPFHGTSGNDMSMDAPAANPSATAITATLGISIEPLESVQAQIATLSSTASSTTSTTATSNALVPLAAPGNVSPDSVVAVAQKVMTHLYNHVTSFATAVLPTGSTVLVPAGGPGSAVNVLSGAGAADSSYLPVKAFNDWYQNVIRKAKTDPMFMTRE